MFSKAQTSAQRGFSDDPPRMETGDKEMNDINGILVMLAFTIPALLFILCLFWWGKRL